jgi:photosystem II stability/assembly factor-like uncharacterized protein
MLDWISYDDNNLMGVESIAADPADPQTVYLACGTYTRSANGAVLISRDGGRRFMRIDMPFPMGGNENGRGNGERMAVDPLNSDIIYLGTRQDGLWRSLDRAASWQRVHSFPDVREQPDTAVPPMRRSRGSGVVFILFDPTGSDADGCRTIYAGVSLMNRPNLFVSHDAGISWEAVAGQPQAYRPTHGILAGGYLYLTYGTDPGPMPMQDGAVWKYHTKTGQWEDISPVKTAPGQGLHFGYAAVSVDASNPLHLIVSTFGRPPKENKHTEDDLFRSTDGGRSWTSIFSHPVEMDYTGAPYTRFTPLHWMFDIEIDPLDPDHALFTTGYGGWETFNLGDAGRDDIAVRWQIMATGIEETVPLELYSPGKGAHILSAIGDYGGFTHFDLDNPPPAGPHAAPYFANTSGLTGAEANPSLIVRVGTVSAHHPGGTPLAYSEDGGISWKMPLSLPGDSGRRAGNGHIAVSADGHTWVWTPARMNVFYTSDKGDSWTPSQGIPGIRVVADRVNPRRFYGIDIRSGVVYESHDGGMSFTPDSLLPPLASTYGNRGDSRGGQDRLYTVPGREGEYWIAAYDGLYLRRPGEPLRKYDKVRRIHAFGFGKGPTEDYPALYMVGIVNGVYGFFRSDDIARSWVRINDDDHQYGLVLHICGDPKKYGRVYVGTHGRGLLCADPAK